MQNLCSMLNTWPGSLAMKKITTWSRLCLQSTYETNNSHLDLTLFWLARPFCRPCAKSVIPTREILRFLRNSKRRVNAHGARFYPAWEIYECRGTNPNRPHTPRIVKLCSQFATGTVLPPRCTKFDPSQQLSFSPPRSRARCSSRRMPPR